MASAEDQTQYDRRVWVKRSAGSRLYERRSYLDEFNSLFVGGRRGSTNCVVVEGPWGTGKTALLGAAGEAARQADYVPIRARGRDLERTSRYSVLVHVLEAVSVVWGAAGVAEIAPLRELLEDLHLSSIAPAELGHRLAAVLGAPANAPPLVFLIDDADQADNESIVTLSSVARLLGPERAWLLASTVPRPPGVALRAVDWLSAEPDTRVLPVAPLPPSAVGQVISEMAGTEPHPAFTARCAEVTGGRPLLLFSLLAALGPEGLEVTAEAADRVDSVVVPRIAREVLARLFKMSIAASDLLQAVAVLGDGADFGDARELAGIDVLAAERGVDAAVHGELLEPGRPLRFTSPLVGAAIYYDIPPSRRSRLHADAARLLAERNGDEAGIRAHLLYTDPAGEDAVAERLHQAGRRALAEGEVAIAAQCFERALAEPPASERRSALLLDLAAAEAALGVPTEAAEHFRQAVQLGVSDPEMLAQTITRLRRGGVGLAVFDRRLWPVLQDAAHALRSREPAMSLELLLILSSVADPASFAQGISEIINLPPIRGSAIGRLASGFQVVSTLGRTERWRAVDAADVLEASLSFDELFGPDALASTIQLAMAVLMLRCGRFAPVDEALRLPDAGSEQPTHLGPSATASLLMALSALWQGRLTEAGDAARDALQRSGSGRDDVAVLAQTCLVNVLLEQGRVEAAGKAAAVLPGAATGQVATTFLWVAETRARLLVAEGQARGGLDDLLSLGRYAEAAGIDNPALTGWRQEASRAAAQLGDSDQAKVLANEALRRARIFGEKRTLGNVLRAAAGSAPGPRRVELLSEAVDALEGSAAILEEARALIELGVALDVVDDREEARAALRRGAHLASLCGADALIEFAGHHLRVAGARPRRLVLTGWSSLTPAEARVAAMAALGNTNAGIAATLVVSLKTVEGHLARAYNKLGIHSRKKLVEVYQAHFAEDHDQPKAAAL